ncbi:MAG: hypothetical protein B0W54_05875 [Cellvibrio sp. 79]|nr:MAG: hypothetical protein B0W54_05875 [Cellvibrio sp. 79]
MPTTETKSWDIFCRVIDNYGDIGVCWRLARQLANEHHQQVRLWVDDLNSLIRIWPDVQNTGQQQCAGVEIRHWAEPFPAKINVAQVIIEGFACDIPDPYLQEMAAQKCAGQPPVWINLEYLSAEKWVEDCHGMTSVHPATGLRKTFFFPGFTPKTGGLLRERDLLSNRDSIDKHLFLEQIEVQQKSGSLLVSLFAYENPATASLLSAWINSPTPIHCLVPNGKILTSINQVLGTELETGQHWQQGNLSIDAIPFLTQADYDLLLWTCDINFVRGEDSFIRAQWAGKPFVWHIYPQDEQAHMIKMDAFLSLFLAGKGAEFSDKLHRLWHNWNEFENTGESWEKMLEQLPEWQVATGDWCQDLVQQPDLACQLVALGAGYAPQKTTTEKP